MKRDPKHDTGMVSFAALAIICAWACAGPDHILEPVIAQGGSFFASASGQVNGTGGRTSSTGTLGGASSTSTRTLSDALNFAWADSYNSNGGADVAYQENHFPGTSCVASCHAHVFTFAGTAYLSGGRSAAANAQIGLEVNGELYTTYAGTAGNFFLTVPGEVDWSIAQMAVRTEQGTYSMPLNASANGNCNKCHKDASTRILAP